MNAKRLTAYRVMTTLVLLVSALASTVPAAPQVGRELAPLPLMTAQAASGSWTQTEWTTPNSTLGVVSSGTNQYFRPSSVSSFGQLVGTFGVCAGAGAWCQGPGDSAGGQTLRLLGNHKSDAGNPYSSDLNGDSISELLFASLWNGSTFAFNGGWIYWGQGTPSSPSWSVSQRTDLPTTGAHSVSVADLNGDGRPEVSFGDDISTAVYWGQAGGSYGVQYSASISTALPVALARGIAVADLNADGRPDLVVANRRDSVTCSINSYIYWGQAGGTHGVQYGANARTDLPTLCAVPVAVADLNGDGRPEVLFGNRGGDDISYSVNSYIYWGQTGGPYGVTYTVSARTDLPTLGALGISVADLDSDGLPEVIFGNHTDDNSGNVNSYIYWGQAGGPYGVTYTIGARTNLPAIFAAPVSVADVNNDGQRDVVVQNANGFMRIFWGPLPTSGTATISWTLPITFGFRGLSLSDLNSDGRIDLLVSQQALEPGGWGGGISGRVYFHNGNNSAPYNAAPSFDLPVQTSPSAYASFGAGRVSSADMVGQPRPVYGTAFPVYGVLESMVMDSGQNGMGWHIVSATTSITSGTGITLFVAASDNLSALDSPMWVQVGAMGNGNWTQSISGVSGRYARYKVILWRDRTTEASPALRDITFNYLAAPSAFSKGLPADGAVGQPTNPTLTWNTASGSVNHYRYCIATTNGCTPTTDVGLATSVGLGGLTPGATYYWQVRACADANCNVFTDANGIGGHWSFTVVAEPGAFSKSAPTNGATSQPINTMLSWDAASGTVHHYRYCITIVSGCTPGTNVGTATSTVLGGLTQGTVYYWQVRACANANCTVFTDANGSGGHWSFTVASAPGPFSKSAPADGAVGQPTNPTLTWNAPSSGSVNHYRYCISTVNGCVPATSAGAATSVTLTGLTPGATYYWQVRACADATCTVFTNASGGHWSFTVQSGGGNVDTTGTRKEVTPAVVRMGELVTYTIVLSNSGSAPVTTQVTDTLTVSATLEGATPGYAQSGQTLVWSNVAVPAGGTVVLTITVRAGSGPLPGGYTLNNSVSIGTSNGVISRSAPSVQVEPWRAFVPLVMRP